MENIKMKLTIGEKITMLRQLTGKDQEELAAYLKMPVDTYRKIEDDFVFPKDLQIVKLGKLYGISYDEVLAIGE